MKRFFTVAAALVILGGSALTAQVPIPVPPPGGGYTMDPLAEERATYLKPEVAKEFPRLGDKFKVIGKSGTHQNAIGYALGLSQWINPPAAAGDNPLAGMDELMAKSQYRRLAGFDTAVKPGKQKIVVFAKVTEDGSIKEITNVVLQHADGTWSCKCGSLGAIQFGSLEQLRGPCYGLPLAVYERDVQVAPAPF